MHSHCYICSMCFNYTQPPVTSQWHTSQEYTVQQHLPSASPLSKIDRRILSQNTYRLCPHSGQAGCVGVSPRFSSISSISVRCGRAVVGPCAYMPGRYAL